MWIWNWWSKTIFPMSWVSFSFILLDKEVLTFFLSLHNLKSFQLSVAFHIETGHLFCSTKQMTAFYIKRNTGLKWIKSISWKMHASISTETLDETSAKLDWVQQNRRGEVRYLETIRNDKTSLIICNWCSVQLLLGQNTNIWFLSDVPKCLVAILINLYFWWSQERAVLQTWWMEQKC